jgi:hypothetical protein
VSHDPTISQDPDDLARAQQRSSQRLRPPTEVPGYEIERFLGAGAYGEVWVAVDRNTGRRTAIKFYVHRGGVDWSLLSREVEKLAFLFADRYVVQLIDVGWDASPPYYVMEYLENGSLADRMQKGSIPVNEAVSLFRDITIGLIHAHDKGVLHCDLKPGNILLDQDRRPRLADFGQARLSHEQTPALGTLFYMAPEQADLTAVPDARWDVYALGAILYGMLTGEPPQRTPESLATFERQPGLPEKLAAYRKYIMHAPSPVRHKQVPGVDRDLAEIISRCLHPNPVRRFPNPQAVLNALDARTLRQARRPLLVLGAIGPAVLLAVITWFAWSVYGTAVRESDDALSRRAIETNDFAAQFVAETVAGQIDRRWQALEEEASDRDLRAIFMRAAAAPKISPADSKLLQEWVERLDRRHPEIEAASWSMLDVHGDQVARVPYDAKTVGKNYAFRDYFNGKGGLPEGTPGIEPIQAVHLSNVFVSQSTQERKVAFSVPVWSTEAEDAARKVVGVLSVTVAIGKFSEMRADDTGHRSQIAVLVDGKNDSDDRAGAILEHPHLAAHGAEASPKPAYFDAAGVERLRKLSQHASSASDVNYHDPLDHESGTANRWIAAFQPVVVAGRPADVGTTGWVVIVQERYDEALKPAQELGEKLMRYGLTALGVVVAVVTALWGFVMIVLNEGPQNRFTKLIRRYTGSGVSLSTASTPASIGDSANEALTSAARPQTVTLLQTAQEKTRLAKDQK